MREGATRSATLNANTLFHPLQTSSSGCLKHRSVLLEQPLLRLLHEHTVADDDCQCALCCKKIAVFALKKIKCCICHILFSDISIYLCLKNEREMKVYNSHIQPRGMLFYSASGANGLIVPNSLLSKLASMHTYLLLIHILIMRICA